MIIMTQAIFNAVIVNNLEAIKKIKNTDKCNPFNDTFNSFLLSYELGFENITRLLWNKKYISKLNSQHHEIYLKVTKNYISNNIINF